MIVDDVPAPTDADAPAEDGLDGRQPPYDMAAEQSTLGGLMLASLYGPAEAANIIDDVFTVVDPGDFYQPKHELVAAAIRDLHRQHKPVDVIAVTDALATAGQLSRAGGAEYLHTLTGAVPSASNAAYYASIVAEKAVLRRLVEAGTRIVQMGYASEGTSEELVEHARAEVDALAGRQRIHLSRIADTFDTMLENLLQPPTFLPTPWASLNKIIGGLAPGNLCVFAARPGGGKSISLLQIATRLARPDGGAVAFSSLEMQREELDQRLLAQFGGIHMTTIRSHALSPIDWNSAAEGRAKVIDAPIFIDTAPGQTVAHIRAHARALQRKTGNLAAIVVDYLQIVKAPERRHRQERYEVVTETAEAFKALAKEFNVPVIVAAQLRRAGAGRGGKKPAPTMEDLRESGGIENTADLIVLQHRPSDEKADIELIVAKHRNGPQGKVTLRWQGEYARLLDRSWSPTPYIDDEEAV